MTKKELVSELHSLGELWASESYSKEYLKEYLDETKKARSMSLSELAKMIGLETEGK